MSLSSAKTRAMMLLKAACDAGKARQAMAVLQSSGSEIDGTVNWTAAVPRLNALVEGLPVAASRRTTTGLDVHVVDDMDVPLEP